MAEELLIIFVKNPVAGKVKTRLAESIGSRNALHIYKILLRHTHAAAYSINVDTQVWYSSKIDRTDLWENGSFDKYLQKGENLGRRMSDAIGKGFDDGYSRVVIIGSDCADLTSGHIRKAFTELTTADCVIGPARDGGYYLLGLSRFLPDLFEEIEWSKPTVLEDTIKILGQNNFTVELLEELNDIDTIEDLKQSGLKIEALD
ncbi:TIGR04282 family arsenosugar biosynthesis glycosyltransferase [soil metagenome]